MLILTAYKSVLLGDAGISARLKGGIHINTVEQGALKPNILLKLSGSGQDYSHQGPTALMDAGIVVECRADKDETAGLLGEAVLDLLQSWTGTVFKCWVQLTMHENSQSEYDAVAKIHIYRHEFTSFYRKVQ